MLHMILVTMLVLASCNPDVVTLKGDVMIGGLFRIQDNVCSEYSASSIQIHQAVRWMLKQLNERNFIPNVTIGLMAYKTCGQPTLAVRHAVQMVKATSENSTSDYVFGILGPEKSSETQPVSQFLSSLPPTESLLQMSYQATAAALGERTIYKNLYRVIESDTVQVQVIVQLLLKLNWNYVAIAYGDDIYGVDGARAVKEVAESHGICIPIFQMIQDFSSVVSLREKLDLQFSPVSGMIFFGRRFAKTIIEYLDKHLIVPNFQLIVSEALALEPTLLQDGNNVVFDRAKGLLIPTPVYEPVEVFSSYWNSLFRNQTLFLEEAKQNLWIREYFESLTGCILESHTDIDDCWKKSTQTYVLSQQPLFISYAILGAGVIAQVFKNVHVGICNGRPGLCDEMKLTGRDRFIEEMETLRMTPKHLLDGLFPTMTNISFSAGKLEIPQGETIYTIFNFQKDVHNQFQFKKVGSFNGSLQVNPLQIHSYDKFGVENGPVDGQCPPGFSCSECLPNASHQVIHIPGDFYVIGLVPIHNKQPANTDQSSFFQYGPLRDTVSVDIAEAMVHAVHIMNSKAGRFKSLLGSKKVGLVILDTSNNPLIVQDKIVSLHKGEMDLGGGMMSSQILDKIIGYAGPVASSISIPISPTMKLLNQLFIAYGSTSDKLNDREEHPTFMRTSASLDTQVVPMMKVAKELGMTYIQVLYTNESYGQSGMEAVLRGAKQEGVCVAQVVSVKEGVESDEYKGKVNELRGYRNARLVIVFARSHTTPVLMKSINEEIDVGEFIFLGAGEGWAKRLNIISGNFKLKGSLTMAQEIPTDPQFEEYFHNISANSLHNPWLRTYLEQKANCYFEGSFVKKSSDTSNLIRPCTADILSAHRQIDTWVPFAANAVYSLVLGFNSTLTAVCSGVIKKCPAYSTNELIRHTKDVRLDNYRDGTLRRVFKDDGNGASGFKISQIVQSYGSEDLVYKDVGIATDLFRFDRILLDKSVTYGSACPTEYECERCKMSEPQQSTAQIHSTANVSLLAVVGTEAAVILVLSVVIVVISVKYRKVKKDDYADIDSKLMNPPRSMSLKADNVSHDYLTAIADNNNKTTCTGASDNETSPEQIHFENPSDG